MLDNLLAHARKNRRGILTASRYLSPIKSCVDGTCLASLEGGQERWEQVLKEADARLVYGAYDVKDLTTTQVTKGSILDFDAILTSTRRDRDGDVLKSAGARVDPSMPLLFGHNPMAPIGKLHRVLSQDDKRVTIKCGIADVPLGRDCATLVEFGGLRISHGFNPEDFEPNKAGDGWIISAFDVLEVSLVSVPSNTDAIITAFDRQKLHHPLIKGWAEKKFRARPTSVNVPFSVKEKLGEYEVETTAPTLESARALHAFAENGKSHEACGCKEPLTESAAKFKENGDLIVNKHVVELWREKGAYFSFADKGDGTGEFFKASLPAKEEQNEREVSAWLVKQTSETQRRIGRFAGTLADDADEKERETELDKLLLAALAECSA